MATTTTTQIATMPAGGSDLRAVPYSSAISKPVEGSAGAWGGGVYNGSGITTSYDADSTRAGGFCGQSCFIVRANLSAGNVLRTSSGVNHARLACSTPKRIFSM